MGLNRLENFLKNIRGEILYVDQNSLDATDSIENQGNSPLRPFISIQRALLEAVRFSYQRGLNNDRFAKTTIKIAPGEYLVDNRPGLVTSNGSVFKNRAGSTISFGEFGSSTNFDLNSPNNDLYKLNSIHGGVIIPRGVSIIGEDYRKVKIRPLYVPNPENDDIETSAIFRLTGGSYARTFSVFDANPNGIAYIDYTQNTFVPNFSHHKLTVFEYADGVNSININDAFQTFLSDETDLSMYYAKVGMAFGPSSGREIQPDFPSTEIDIQPVIGEYEIVGSRGKQVGITSIFAGDGTTTSNVITAILAEDVANINVDTPIEISGIISPGYNGNYSVSYKNGTQIQYKTSTAPLIAKPDLTSQSPTLNIVVDTVKSASPYVKEVALLSVYGMSGLHADGSKADGFRSMVVSEFTGISLQRDDNAFVKYNKTTGTYNDRNSVTSIHSDSKARFRPSYENYHIKCSNGAFAQLVSIFAIGFANNFIVDSGADQSITGSNSNFGARALYASGFKSEAFPRDDVGFITHIIPPKEIEFNDISVEYTAVNVALTIAAANNQRLYLYGETNLNSPPDSVIEGYRIGAKNNDTLNVFINNDLGQVESLSASIVMQNSTVSSKKSFSVTNISANTITLSQNHTLSTGESIRLISEDGEIPDGLNSNQIYYAITTNPGNNLNANQIRVAQTLNEATSNTFISINNKGLNLVVESRVSDKKSGEYGHPIQYDSVRSNWYINVSNVNNTFYTRILALGTAILGSATPRTYITRTPDSRNLEDRLYKVRYVIPKNAAVTSRPPLEGFILQESNSTLGSTTAEIVKYLNPTSQTISSVNELKNYRTLANATWGSNTATFTSEEPHNLIEDDEVQILNVKSSNNTTAVPDLGYNGTFKVTNILNRTQFQVRITTNPGTFQNNIAQRDTSLPYFKRKKYADTLIIYRVEELQEYIPSQKDGIYHLTLINASNSPKVQPFTELEFSQPITNLYPQINRDNPVSDPSATICSASSDILGKVVVNDPEKSITKETLTKLLKNTGVGIAITNISSSSGTNHTIYTKYDHGFSAVAAVNIINSGSGYGEGIDKNYYNAQLVSGSGNTATASVRVSAAGNITSVNIVNGGSAFSIGDNLSVVGIASTTIGFVAATVQVNRIINNINNSVTVTGIGGTYSNYNTSYRITSIVNNRQLSVDSYTSIGNVSPSFNPSSAILLLDGRVNVISSITYDRTTGVSTVITTNPNEYQVGHKIAFSNFSNSFFNKEVVVQSKVNLNTITVNFGKSSTTQSIGAETKYTSRLFLDSQGGINSKESENRISPFFDQFNFYSAAITASSSTISIPTSGALDLNVGDYIIIDNEIMRIAQTISNTASIPVLRGLFGTTATAHENNSVVRRIKVIPVETRRNSIMRVSGHTFEYVGFGPGNYSTTLPERQDRQLLPAEQINSQSLKTQGGSIIFNGINNDGDTYTINTKVNSSTGRNEIYNSPIPTVTGEDLVAGGTNVGFDINNPLEINVSRSINVEGGPDSNIISRFNGPVVFNNKVSFNSNKGIESNSIYLQGDSPISRKYTVGISTPSLAGNPGDVVFKDSPISGGSLGWVYTLSNRWEEFGLIRNNGQWNGTFYGTFIGDISGVNVPNYWTVTSTGISTTKNFSVGVNSPVNAYKFYVNGLTRLNGSLSVVGGADFTGSVTVRSSANVDLGLNINNASYIKFNGDKNSTYTGGVQWISRDVNTSNTFLIASLDNIYVNNNQTDIIFNTYRNLPNVTNLDETLRVKGDGNVVVAGSLVSNSDIRLKTNIKPIEDSLNKVMNLRGVEYDRVDTNSHQLGLIAQEVEKVIPEIVHGDSTKSIAYDSLIPVLIEAIKELKNEIEELKNNK